MKKFIAEFKEFALKGNMIDLAIGMIIATSFNAVVKSIVDDLIMPAFALVFKKSDFSQLVAFADYKDGVLVGGIKYGMFIQNIVNFLIIAFCLFITIKFINKLKKKPEPVEEAPEEPAPKPDDIVLLEEIRDLLAKEKANQ